MDINYIDLRFENNGKILEVGKGSSYRLLSIDGIDSANYKIDVRSNTLADGSRVNNKRVVARDIIIEAEYTGRNKKEERDNIVNFFNLHNEGILHIDSNGVRRIIPYHLEKFNSKLDNMYRPLSFLISLYCEKPYLLGEFEQVEEVVSWIGGFSFPLRLPTTFAMAGEKVINVFNDGEVETPMEIIIYGPAKNPKLIKRDTGEYLRIKKILTSDDVIVITTGFGNKRVELNGKNAFNLLDLPSSTFFDLSVGDNVLELITEDETDSANVKISYRNKYLGV